VTERAGGPRDTVPVRRGDALDAAALSVWLHAEAPSLLAAGASPLSIRQFGGGFSNLTYLVEGGAQPFVLRRPPHGVSGGIAHDVLREHRVLAAMRAARVPVPQVLAACDDVSVLGAPFFLMEYVDGVILRQTPPAGVVFDATVAAGVAEMFVQQLASLHALEVDALGLTALGRGDGYVARQIAGWCRRWEQARTRDVPSIDRIGAWLAANRPDDRGVSLLHNDFKYDNLVLDPNDLTRIRAILDWEMATVGCPLMDLGTSLAYWLEPDDPPLLQALGLGVTATPGSPTRRELVRRYEAVSGRDVDHPVFYYAYGVFKLAVVAQQIFARFERGLTRDPRFARLGEAVVVLGASAEQALETGRIGRG
jgi:aminoglycoside phosphotransferase (APT) family kinase protein